MRTVTARGLWSMEEDVVPMASATAVETPATNGDRADGDRSEDPPLARSTRLSAGEFTPERMMRATTDAPMGGWLAGSICSRVGS